MLQKLLYFSFIFFIICSDQDKQKTVSELKSPLTVSGKATIEKNCMFGEIISKGGIEAKTLQTKKLEAKVLKTKLLKVGTLQAKIEGHPIVMNGSIAIYKMKTSEKNQKVLLQKFQWEQFAHLDFRENEIALLDQKCEGMRDVHYLGGVCQNKTISKLFNNIPIHNYLKIEFALHVFDQWDQEQIQLIVDNKIQWKNIFTNSATQQNFCGNSYGDQINIPISKVIEHNQSDLNLTLQGLSAKSTCMASFAMDNLIIQYK